MRWILLAVSLGCLVVSTPLAAQSTSYPWKTGVRLKTYTDPALNKSLFYAALPFDDLAHPDLAQKWIPADWWTSAGGKSISICKERWIQIKDATGRSCYVQWEGNGSLRTDDVEYVFGTAPPQGVGLLISPGVAHYLSLDTVDKDHPPVSWRFVDAKDVPPGYWLVYAEQAVLLTGIHQQDKAAAAKSTPPAATLPELYVKAYLMINEGQTKEHAGDWKEARAAYAQAQAQFKAMATIDPTWEQALIISRMRDIKTKIDSLDAKKLTVPSVSDVH